MAKLNKTEIYDLYKKYLAAYDPTEYQFAMRYLGSWEAWDTLSTQKYMRKSVNDWRKELEVRIRSEALGRIIDASREDTRDGLAANKYLLEGSWTKEETKRGRPSKIEIDNELKKQASNKRRVKEDFERINNAL